MTKSLRDALFEIDKALADAKSAANANRVLVDAFFPDHNAEYPLWAHDCDAQAFKYLADDVIAQIGRVQGLVQAHVAAHREASS